MKATKKQGVWLEHIQKCEALKLSISDYARQNEIKPQQLYQARSDLRKQGLLEKKTRREKPTSSFTRVQVQPPFTRKARSEQCEVRLTNGLSFRFDINLDIDKIRHTVAALSGISA